MPVCGDASSESAWGTVPSPPFINSMRVVRDGDACTTHHAAFVLQVGWHPAARLKREHGSCEKDCLKLS